MKTVTILLCALIILCSSCVSTRAVTVGDVEVTDEPIMYYVYGTGKSEPVEIDFSLPIKVLFYRTALFRYIVVWEVVMEAITRPRQPTRKPIRRYRGPKVLVDNCF